MLGTSYEDQYVDMTFDILLPPIKKFTASWIKLFAMHLNCRFYF